MWFSDSINIANAGCPGQPLNKTSISVSMPRISEHVGIERKPKLGGGGPGKIPHRHGYGGGDDGDHGEPDDFISPKDRLRRYRIGMTAAIVAFSAFFIGMALSYL